MKRRDISMALFAAAGGVALQSRNAEAQACVAPCYPQSKAEQLAGVTPANTSYPPQNVLRYGADPTGATDSTSAFRQLALVIAKGQQGQIASNKLSTTVAIIPEGYFLLSGAIQWNGPISIVGAATAGWEGGTTIVQSSSGVNIFEFLGSLDDGKTLGVHVQGISFGFMYPGGGVALHVPKNGPNLLSSNSLYFEDCRFGGFNPNGIFLQIDHGNDIVVSRCLFDVSAQNVIQLGNDQDSSAICTDVAIVDCGFYYNACGIRIYHAKGVTISGNRFFGFPSGYVPIFLNASTSIVENSIEAVVITGNVFDGNHGDIYLDGSTSGVQISANEFYNCNAPPISTTGTIAISGLHIGPNQIKVIGTYNYSYIISSGNCQISNSTISDNQVNCNGVNALNQLAGEVSNASQFGAGMTIRNNTFINNPTYPYAGHYDYKPCSARELVLEQQLVYSGYPAGAPVFHLNNFQIGQSVTFDLDWEVIVTKTGTDIGASTGLDRISIIYWQNSGSLKSNVTRISSVSDNYDGGGANLPSVTFSVSAGSPAQIQITVSDALNSPTTTVNLKASNFRATASNTGGVLPQIKNA